MDFRVSSSGIDGLGRTYDGLSYSAISLSKYSPAVNLRLSIFSDICLRQQDVYLKINSV